MGENAPFGQLLPAKKHSISGCKPTQILDRKSTRLNSSH